MRGVVFVLLVGCTAAPPEIFAGAGTSVDAGTFDAGDLPPIADAGPRPDAGSPDAGSPDAGSPDAGSPDAGVRPRLSFTIVEIPDVNWPGDIAINSRGDVVGSYYAASLGSGVTRSFLFDSSTATTGSIGFGTAKGQFATGI